MEDRNSGCLAGPPVAGASIFRFLFAIFCAATLAACGAPGEPKPPWPVVPVAVSDLAAQQQGNSVVLSFTLPKDSVEGAKLESPPDVEIFRRFIPAGEKVAAPSASSSPVYIIPGGLVDTYKTEGRVRFPDMLKPEEVENRGGQQVAYIVRARASKRRASADSNVAVISLYTPPPPVATPAATVSQEAIAIRWQASERTATGRLFPTALTYRVYRAEVAPGSEEEATRNPAAAKLKAPLAILGVTTALSYRDEHFEFGRTYLYIVRSVAEYEAGAIESADSPPLLVTPRDVFPPAPPKELAALLVPGAPGQASHVELSWAISPEPDLAGYNIYRSEQEGTRGRRLNEEMLLTPAFRDMDILVGRLYIYTVTGVDQAGNESLPSAPVSVTIPSEGMKP